MASTDALFGELRSLGFGQPGLRTWDELCALLESWPDAEHMRQVVLPYLQGKLGGWPLELRPAPQRWVMQWFDGAGPPAIRSALVDCVELRHPGLGRKIEAVYQQLFQGPRRVELRGIVRQRDLETLSRLAAGSLRALRLEPFDSLHAFEHFHEPGMSALLRSGFSGLERLEISGALTFEPSPWVYFDPRSLPEGLRALRLEQLIVADHEPPARLSALQSLTMCRSGCSHEELHRWLARLEHAPLESLHLEGCGDSVPRRLGFGLLRDRPLRRLCLEGIALQRAELDVLLDEASWWSQLEELRIQSQWRGDLGRTLGGWRLSLSQLLPRLLPRLGPGLRSLALSGHLEGDEDGLRHFLDWPQLARLEQIDLRQMDLSDEQQAAILARLGSPLQVLYLGARAGQACALQLACGQHFPRLRQLHLHSDRLDAQALSLLAEAPIPRLEALSVRNAEPALEAMEALSQSQGTQALVALDLVGSSLRGFQLQKSCAATIHTLDLSSTRAQTREDGANDRAALLGPWRYPNLRRLRLQGSGVSMGMLTELFERRTAIELVELDLFEAVDRFPSDFARGCRGNVLEITAGYERGNRMARSNWDGGDRLLGRTLNDSLDYDSFG